MKKLAIFFILGFLLSAFVPNVYASIVIDGRTDNDWGVTPRGYNNGTDMSDWVPDSGIIYKAENQKGGLSSYLNPGYGGQLFDAEAIYYKKEGGFLYLAIVTGMPNTGAQDSAGRWYYPGDIAIDFSGDGVYEYGIKTRNGSGGKFYKGLISSDWNVGLWGAVSDPTSITNSSSKYFNTVEFAYNNTYYYNNTGNYNKHYVMEMAIPDYYFGEDWKNGGKIHWTQTCGNDSIDLDIPKTVPEPATISLIGIGLAGLFLRRRNIKK